MSFKKERTPMSRRTSFGVSKTLFRANSRLAVLGLGSRAGRPAAQCLVQVIAGCLRNPCRFHAYTFIGKILGFSQAVPAFRLPDSQMGPQLPDKLT